jgi:hypothetical protein
MNDADAFARLVEALRPWLGDLMFVGGWAHQLHRSHPDADPPPYPAIRTRDADLALAARARLEGSIRDALQAAGFTEELLGDDTPPATHYHLGESDGGFYAEFIAPRTGSGLKRDGTAADTIRVAGVAVQRLRYVDVLLVAPWPLELRAGGEIPLRKRATLSVANPVSFIVQKLLIHDARKPNKRAQDALYVHDTIQLFGARLAGLRSLWSEAVCPALHKNAVARVPRLIDEQYGRVTDVIRNAVRIPQGRAVDPAEFQAACQVGLNEVFGND